MRLGEARAIKNDIERARAELAAERQYQRELRRIEAQNRQRRREAPAAARLERRSESDDEVCGNIPPELVALFERVKRSIKATPRMTRTEAFLHYAEEHPDEVLHVLEDKTEALIADLERRERELAREARREGRRPSARAMADALEAREGMHMQPPAADAESPVPFDRF